MTENHEKIVPPEIIEAFYGSNVESQSRLTGGIVNSTYLIVEKNGNKTILQGLSPIFDASMGIDYAVVSNHLRTEDWEVAYAIESKDGVTYQPDNSDRLWRGFSHIESEQLSAELPKLETVVGLSGLLGRLHKSLSKLDYLPVFSLPHFHDTAFYISELRDISALLPNIELKRLAKQVISLAEDQLIGNEDSQLIHGDPQMNNALYRGGTPFTFIDFDTLMKANPLVDIGDMLRSVVEKILTEHPKFSVGQLEPVLEAYHLASQSKYSQEVFSEKALSAGQTIALELGARFMIDVVKDNYFEWDNKNFCSRSEHNASRAYAQLETYKALLGD